MGKEELITINNPLSPVAEAYRTLRTNIQFSSIDKKVQVIAVTSSGPGEGKSTIAANLAVVTAQAGKKTLLIDCDQRKPRQHKVFGLSNEYGLSNLLAEEASFAAVVQKSGVDNLLLLTSGTKPPNPSELLASSKMKNFIHSLRGQLDFIIIDTPPLLMVTDAQLLSNYIDGYILTIASGEADREAAAKAKELLDNVNGKILGAVLNKLDMNDKGYYGYYSHYYYGVDGEKHKD
ncbi:MAG: putative exopolysaccharide biosynthesis protein, partial [Firmicutes bacterium]|nr:putative exopolysaccharide biosynthesis protein [Bacillota bacterium]